MILLDSSVWIDFLNGIDASWTRSARHASETGSIVSGDLVVMEVLRGIKDDKPRKVAREVLFRYPLVSLCGLTIAEVAAANYRLLRRRGITVRGTIDVIIATWCIVNRVPIIHNDRDLAVMERELGLVSYTV